jgi:hypothetical protein
VPPAPKVEPVRRNPRVGPLKLPAGGRQGPPPDWPLSGELDAQLRRIWIDVWHTPQAVEWERLGWNRVVARYCLVLGAAEQLDMQALAEARQLEDRLGLTPKSMRMLLWQVVTDEVAAKREMAKGARGRVKAVS